MSIDPDVSMTNVRLAGGRSASARPAVLMPIPHEPGAVVGARGVAGLDDDAEPAVGRYRIAVVEGVDPLLDADRRRVGERALVQERLADGPRAGVDVEAERRLGVVGRGTNVESPPSTNTLSSNGPGTGGGGAVVVIGPAAVAMSRAVPALGIGAALVSISPSRYSVMYERASMSGRAVGWLAPGAGAGGEDDEQERREESDAHGHPTPAATDAVPSGN